uniref:Uncharacterized protein n=1 Tax=Haptolina ericina TaxID=156174 RepID=A0A7S3AJ00_9EUKA
MHAHQKQPSPASCPAQALVPQTFLADALLLRKQEDTFLHAEQRTHLGEPVSVLHFKQPGRLSNLELPFALVLLADINPAGIVEVPTPANEAKDSWFPDFSWNHWVVCSQPDGSMQHLGWRFTRKPSARSTGPESFVAMIVRVVERSGPLASSVGALAETELVREATPSSASLAADLKDAPEEVLLPELDVGIDAPTWLVGLAMAFSSRSASPM